METVDVTIDTARVVTSWPVDQLEMFEIAPMTRGDVRRRLELRVAESRADVAMVGHVWRERHYLRRSPVPPRVKVLHVAGQLAGVAPGGPGCSVAVTVALLSSTKSLPFQLVCQALDVHPCSVLELVRCWRDDRLTPEVAPDLMPLVLRRLVAGGNGLEPLRAAWDSRKLGEGLTAPARVLLTYADPGVGHDGGLYRGAGGVLVGQTKNGKLCFAWALDGALRDGLKALSERRET